MSHYIAESVEALKKKSTTKGRLYESRGRYYSENRDGYRVGERDGSDSEVPPSIDFTANPDVVRVVVEGERLTYGHLFNLSFAIVNGSDAKTDNPFIGSESDQLIVSVDTLRGDAMFSRLQEPEVVSYDLVVFD